MAGKIADVHETTVFADHVETVLERKTRYDYMMGFFPTWKELIRRKLYMYSLIGAGLLALFYYPALSIAAFFGAAYHYERIQQRTTQLASKARHVMMGH
jgi:hypothetical protein